MIPLLLTEGDTTLLWNKFISADIVGFVVEDHRDASMFTRLLIMIYSYGDTSKSWFIKRNRR
jgi:hypothetical protein